MLSAKRLNHFKLYLHKYEHFLSPVIFALGFIFDLLTLGRVDDIFNIFVQVAYLILLYFILIAEFRNWEPSGSNKILNNVWKFKDEIFHFFLGSLLSAFTLFYFKSSSIFNSLIFMGFFTFMLLINEFEQFQKLGTFIKSGMLKLCLISFVLIAIPTFFGKIGFWSFIFSLALSAIPLIGLFFYLKKSGVDKQIIKFHLVYPSSLILFLFLSLYMLKIIPPIPLSIQKIGIYHDVKKNYPEYLLYQETPKWKFWRNGDQDYKAKKGEKIYLFTRIFSPGGFRDKIYVRWQIDQDGWKTSDRIPLEIKGGREQGFRGIAWKSNYKPGDWRILVETSDEREIGRIYFSVSPDTSPDPKQFNIVVDR